MIICDFNIKHNQKPLNTYNYFGPSHKPENVLQHIYGMMSGHINEIVSPTCTFQVVQYILL